MQHIEYCKCAVQALKHTHLEHLDWDLHGGLEVDRSVNGGGLRDGHALLHVMHGCLLLLLPLALLLLLQLVAHELQTQADAGGHGAGDWAGCGVLFTAKITEKKHTALVRPQSTLRNCVTLISLVLFYVKLLLISSVPSLNKLFCTLEISKMQNLKF